MSNLAAIDDVESQDVYLKSFLKPFAQWLDAPDVTEILVNKPGEVWIEKSGASAMERIEDAAIDNQLLQRLAVQIARVSHQAVNREQPLLSAMLPGGERIQMAGPPAAGDNWALAIRRHLHADVVIEDFVGDAGFTKVVTAAERRLSDSDAALCAYLREKRIGEFLRAAVRSGKSMLISGGTSTGKTSLLNALLREVSDNERIITVEDTAEVRPPQLNHLSLVAVKGVMGEARIDIMDLLEAALRMRPDRIILGEVRGKEAATFLRAINTGHPGSITTVHADSARGALDQLALMVMQAGFPLSRQETVDYILSIVDVIIQLGRNKGSRQIEEVFFAPFHAPETMKRS